MHDDPNDWYPRGLTCSRIESDYEIAWHQQRYEELMREYEYDPAEWDFECLPQKVQDQIINDAAWEWHQLNRRD